MQDWVKNNLITLVVLAATLIANYTLTGFRLTATENRLSVVEQSVKNLNDSDTNTKVAIGQINTNLEFIKAQLAQLTQLLK